MTFLMMLSIILVSVLMILLYSKCDKTSDQWQQLELAFELESDKIGKIYSIFYYYL